MKAFLVILLLSCSVSSYAQPAKIMHTEASIGMHPYWFEKLYPDSLFDIKKEFKDDKLIYLLTDTEKRILFTFSYCYYSSSEEETFRNAQLLEVSVFYKFDDKLPAAGQFAPILTKYVDTYSSEYILTKDESTSSSTYTWSWDDGFEVHLQYANSSAIAWFELSKDY